jgi:alanyl-tRNA synthetase
LLHAALRDALGTHVQQRGSLVAPDRLRFDFSHDEKVTNEQLRQIESHVNNAILRNYPVKIDHKALDVARAEGAMALFGEKYDDIVRTVILEDDSNRFSYELCGGIHVNETAEIGGFLLTNESAVSAGVRRVEALTGHEAVRYVQKQLGTLQQASARLGTTPDQLSSRIEAMQQEVSDRKKEVSQLRSRLAKHEFDNMIDNMESINGVQALIAKLDDVPMDTMRQMSDWFRNKADSGVMVLASDVDSKPQVMVAVTDDLTARGYHAGKLVKEIASVVGGGGGGRPNLAQAGGKDSAKIPEALQKARELLAEG